MSDSDGEWGTVYRINKKKLAEYEKILREGLKELLVELSEEKCDRCGGDLGLVPTICWECFYSFWNATTPEQKKIIKGIESNITEKMKEAFKLSIRIDTYMEWDEKQLEEIDRIIDVVIDSVLNPEAYE